jgi:hypothetical protein
VKNRKDGKTRKPQERESRVLCSRERGFLVVRTRYFLCPDGVGGGVEGVLDTSTQQGQDGDNDEGDQGDEEAIFDQGLTLFLSKKLMDHDIVDFSGGQLPKQWTTEKRTRGEL